MEGLKKKTDEIMSEHTVVCDFYQLAKDDDMRKDSIPFFAMWRDFFKNVEAACPKDDKRKGAKKTMGTGLSGDAQDAMRRQIAELQAKFNNK